VDVLRRVHELQPVGHARDLEHALDRLRAAHEHEPAPRVLQPPLDEHDEPQAARVEELEVAQVDRDDLDAGLERHDGTDEPWPCGTHSGETPNLMLGLAGIGHFLLRLGNPETPPLVALRF
jgi:hypothetical protein